MNSFADNILIELGKCVVKKRKEVNLSQEELAHISNLDRSYISDIENGKRNVSIKTLIILSESLDISITDLFQDISPET